MGEVRVEVLFFGRIADIAGARRMACEAETLLGLRDRVFPETPPGLRMSVNKVQVTGDVALNAGDEVAFFSVFSGG
ncbi:MAG: MoaD/ThiS family protein [Asticcacaulis sp.]|nr:MoaD/ThiS family protein [Asticcacaulis sp.]